MSKYVLQIGYTGHWEDVKEYDDYDAAAEGAGKMFDLGEDSDFGIYEPERKHRTLIYPHTLQKFNCPICGKEVRQRSTVWTYDCHGIPFRRVCENCYAEAVEPKGYDGEYYTELDECIDCDW